MIDYCMKILEVVLFISYLPNYYNDSIYILYLLIEYALLVVCLHKVFS